MISQLDGAQGDLGATTSSRRRHLTSKAISKGTPSQVAGHTVGLIADTHGLLRPEAIRILHGTERIIHAGDIGNPAVLQALRTLAPVTAVRGNVDTEDWARGFPKTATLTIDQVGVYVLHDLGTLDLVPEAAGFRVVVSGHSHRPVIQERNGVLYVNPGSAGPRRFRGSVSLALMKVLGTIVDVRLVPLDVFVGS